MFTKPFTFFVLLALLADPTHAKSMDYVCRTFDKLTDLASETHEVSLDWQATDFGVRLAGGLKQGWYVEAQDGRRALTGELRLKDEVVQGLRVTLYKTGAADPNNFVMTHFVEEGAPINIRFLHFGRDYYDVLCDPK